MHGVSEGAWRARLFTFTLRDRAKDWIASLLRDSFGFMGYIEQEVSIEVLSTLNDSPMQDFYCSVPSNGG